MKSTHQFDCVDRYTFQYGQACPELDPVLTISCPGYPIYNTEGHLDRYPAESITLFTEEAIEGLYQFLHKLRAKTAEEPTHVSQHNAPDTGNDNRELSQTLGQLFSGQLREEAKPSVTFVAEL